MPGFCEAAPKSPAKKKKKAIKSMLLGEDGIRKVLLVGLAGQLAPLAPCVPERDLKREIISRMSPVTHCLIEKDQKVKIDPFQSKNSVFQRAIQPHCSGWHCTSHQPSGTVLPARNLVFVIPAHCGFPTG